MSVKCQRPGCERSGEYQLQLTFVQRKSPGWDPIKGPPRVGLTVRTEGLYCADERKVTLAEVLDAPMRIQVESWFFARDLGKPAFEDTALDWLRATDTKAVEQDERTSRLVRM